MGFYSHGSQTISLHGSVYIFFTPEQKCLYQYIIKEEEAKRRMGRIAERYFSNGEDEIAVRYFFIKAFIKKCICLAWLVI
jgi:hypothetical protein